MRRRKSAEPEIKDNVETMALRLKSVPAMMIGAAVLFAAPNCYAFTAGSDDVGGSPSAMPEGGSPAAESPGVSDSGRYNFSDRNFNVSVERNEPAPEPGDDPDNDGDRRTSAAVPPRSPGFFDRIWSDFSNFVGIGD